VILKINPEEGHTCIKPMRMAGTYCMCHIRAGVNTALHDIDVPLAASYTTV